MTVLNSILVLALLLLGLIGALFRMGAALDEFDLERFVMWTCIASIIAGMPLAL